MNIELEILKDVTSKLESLNIPYMLTGSYAMNYYAIPRLTRDLDIVTEIYIKDIDKILKTFSLDYYIVRESILEAIRYRISFNIIHNKKVLKVDFIVRKDDEYRLIEFSRRKKVKFDGFNVFIVSLEDLIISKLIWAKDSHSDYQLRDVKNLMDNNYDKKYLNFWANKLHIDKLLEDCINE
jgi:hypothetical protein